MKARISKEARKKRLTLMFEAREKYLKDINNCHVKLMKGNTKTGKDCYTVSLIPIVDCKNCKECMVDCYDINTDCRFPGVIESRALNSAIHLNDIERYFNEISSLVKSKNIKELRYNVGGDFVYEDFIFVNRVAVENPQCEFLFFTKSYDDINKYIDDHGDFAKNVHPIISRWLKVDCNNKYNLPESHVLYEDGRTTAPQFGSKYCQGNCSNCFAGVNDGCPTLKKGESVIFKAH